jgi:hypothetical protein
MLPRPVTIRIAYWYPLVKVNAEPWRVHCEQLEPMLNVVVVTLFGAIDGPLQFVSAYSLPLESVT